MGSMRFESEDKTRTLNFDSSIELSVSRLMGVEESSIEYIKIAEDWARITYKVFGRRNDETENRYLGLVTQKTKSKIWSELR